MAVALTLPRSQALTDALLEPVPELSAAEVAAVRSELAASLASLASELPTGRRLVIDAFTLSRARRHPERCRLEDPPFVISALTCRRAVGLAVVNRCLRAGAQWPGQVVDEVLAVDQALSSAAEQGSPRSVPWWSTWYGGLGPGGRAVVAAEALTWATALWTALEFDRLPRPVAVAADDWWNVGDGRALALHGRSDVRATTGARSLLVTMAGGVPDDRSRHELAFPALVAALANPARPLPGRVLGLWPSCGQVRLVDVDIRLLRSAADAVVSATATWVDAALDSARNISATGDAARGA